MARRVSAGAVLVTGATGRQGCPVLRHLPERGWPVRTLTRRPDSPAAPPPTAAEITAGLGAAPYLAR